MSSQPPNYPDAPVLVLAPSGNDARNTAAVLDKVSIRTQICADMGGLCHGAGEQSGAFLVSEEACDEHSIACLLEFMSGQPTWSDIPLVLLATAGEIRQKTYNILNFLGPRANVTLLEKPLRAFTLISVIKAALRSRNHQYEVRDLLKSYSQAMEDAQRSTAKFRAVFDQSSVFAGIMTIDGTVMEANRLSLEVCGYRAEEVLGRPFWECGWWRGSKDVQQKLRTGTRQAAQGTSYRETLPYIWADGTERMVEFRLYPIRDEAGQIIFLHPTGVDITERRQTLARFEFLSQLTQKLSTLSDPGEINRIATREIGQFLAANGCYFFQAIPERGEVRALPDWRRVGEAGPERICQIGEFGPPEWWRAVQLGPVVIDDVRTHPWMKDFQSGYHTKNILSYILVPFIHEGRWVASICVSSDRPRHWTTEEKWLLESAMARAWPLIERAHAERALRESEERFRAMGDNIGPLAWMTDASGWIFWYNKRWYEYTGMTFEAMQGWAWEKMHHPDHLARVLSKWRSALSTGQPWEDTFPLLGADGKYRWFLSRAFPIHDANGKVTLWFGTNTDVTELRETQDALHEANKLLADKAAHLETLVQQRTAKLRETVGELEAFSYSIVHDLRAPLRSLQGFSTILITDYGGKLDEECQRFLHLIANSVSRMDKLILDVLNYSKVVRAELPLETVNVEQLLLGIMHTYPMFAPDKADILLAGPFPSVLGNEAMLMQVFSNLMGNAVKFVSPGQKPKIRVWAESRGQNVRLFVQDNGIGIASDQHERIFAIFQRVDQSYEGTGIGLAIVKKAVERMGCKVGLQSEPGKGSTFWIEIQRKGVARGSGRE